jgi:predicted DNA-binding transcriptional regulator AlpA
MSTVSSELDVWISARECAKILGITRPSFDRLKGEHAFTVRKLPGMNPRYLRREVEELAAKSTSTTTEGK